MQNINQLLVRTAQSDQQAFQQLYKKTSPRLFALCLRLTNNQQALAEDILQEAYLKIWVKAGQFNANKGHATTWMSRIVTNHFYDMLRAQKARPHMDDTSTYESIEFSAATTSPDTKIEQDELIKAFSSSMIHQSNKQRLCIEMAVKWGFTHTEVSQQMNVPLGTVKAWIRRALHDFRRHHQCPSL